MNIQLFNSEKKFLQASLDEVSALSTSGKDVRIALSGGSTPRELYKALGHNEEITLDNIEFFQVDERYVPRDDENSNYRLIEETLLENPSHKPKAFHFFDTSLPLPETLSKYEKELPEEPFDLIFLGIGPDGHTGSLFPSSKALAEKRAVAHTTTDEFAVHNRLTLTFPIILRAKKLIVLLKGKEKQEILRKLLSGDTNVKQYPAKKLTEHPDLHIYLLVDAEGLEPPTPSV